ncbi:mobilization protein, partial [Salmonella enterica subsp. enterica serovar Kentucky]
GYLPHAHIMMSQRVNDGIERSPVQYFRRFNA